MEIFPFSYFNIPNPKDKDKNQTNYYYVNDRVISITQFSEKGIGGLLWDCVNKINLYNIQSVLLLEYFKSHEEIVKNKKCLEISGGCGLISMGISLLGASEVICTELDDILQTNTKKNIENNKSTTSQFEN